MDRGEFIKHGFNCEPGINGGWMVLEAHKDRTGNSRTAAFSNFAEMIAWLEDQHEGLKIESMSQPSAPRDDSEDNRLAHVFDVSAGTAGDAAVSAANASAGANPHMSVMALSEAACKQFGLVFLNEMLEAGFAFREADERSTQNMRHCLALLRSARFFRPAGIVPGPLDMPEEDGQ